MFLRSVIIPILRNFQRLSPHVHKSLINYRYVTIPNYVIRQSFSPFSSEKPVLRWHILTTIMVFLGVMEDPDKKDTPLVLEIKKGILARTRRQYLKADGHFHSALKMAQDQKYSDAEIYIFDCMADNFFEQNDFEKARDLYLEVIGRLQGNLKSKELVEISCKLGYCYSHTGNRSEAEMGFQFGIDTILATTRNFFNDKNSEILVKELDNDQKNSLALLGMCYDYYSKHLEEIHLEYSLAYKLKALKISEIVNGKFEQQTLVLHNDIASVYVQMNEYARAKDNLSTAIYGAKQAELTELPVFYVNLAAIHHQEKRNDLAKQQCNEAKHFLIRYKAAFTQLEFHELLNKCDKCINGDRFY